LKEHKIIAQLFRELEAPEDVELALDNFGNALDEHIRHEERIWFEKIQNVFDEDFLAELGPRIDRSSSLKK